MVAMEESSSSLKVQLMTPQGTAATSASGDVTKRDNQVKLLESIVVVIHLIIATGKRGIT